jgi:hypothetical protein
MRAIAAIAAMLIVVFTAQTTKAESRIALVVGNNAYDSGLSRLANAVNDAKLLSETLRKAGFEVEELDDADRAQMSAAIGRLSERLQASGPGSVGLFYFAGHGLQSGGTNYLMATDAPLRQVEDIARYGLDADTVLRAMLEAGADTNILILDACRPNHVSDILKPVAAAGLVQTDARGKDPNRSVLVAYSTGLGETAADGDDGNSPYAKTLAEHMLRPDLPLEILFRNVRLQMVSRGYQKPWESSGMLRGLAFVGQPRDNVPPPARPVPPGSIVQISDFGSVPTELGLDRFVPADRYLRQGTVPVTIRDVMPASSEVLFYSTAQLYHGLAFTPTISGNVLTQANTGNQAASFTLVLPEPAGRVRFLIPRLFAATASGITFPAWKATALAPSGEAIDMHERELLGSFVDVPEQFVQLESRDGPGIAAVRFESDPRRNGVPFAAFSAILIEGIWIQALPARKD